MNGFKLSDTSTDLSPVEIAWLTFLRDLYGGDVREPTLAAVQALRVAILSGRRSNAPLSDEPHP